MLAQFAGTEIGIAQRMMTGPRGDIRLADPLENFRREARAVILDRDLKIVCIP